MTELLTLDNPSFHAQHSPVGAFFSFTCGLAGSKGGIAAELGRPADQELFIGVKDGAAHDNVVAELLPFNISTKDDSLANYVSPPAADPHQKLDARNFAPGEWRRRYGWATDRFEVPSRGLTFSIYSPWQAIPDPASAGVSELREVLIPAVRAELTLDNSAGKNTRTFFFALRFNEARVRPLTQLGTGRVGWALGRTLGFAAEAVGGVVKPILRWTVTNALLDRHNPVHQLGNCPGVYVEVPAGQTATLRIALGCYIDGIATTGLEAKYFYTRLYASLDDVLGSALEAGSFDRAKSLAGTLDHKLLTSGLDPAQQFLLAHSTRSYHGSTELLDLGGEPYWVVNEGEYRMINTLDLSVDHVFWELAHNPWVVRNLLDNFARHYSYVDTVGGPGEPKTRTGGLSFCHDQGVANNFSPRGTSSYELPELDALCFSYMTAEQVCNWLLIAASYVNATGDRAWARGGAAVIHAAADSLVNRCGGTGVIIYDSSRCGVGGAEITTYDSLDHSLAQTRNNLYMAVKCWASFLAAELLAKAADVLDDYHVHAKRAASAVLAQVRPDGTIPAVFEKGNAGHASRILPAVEGLVYPIYWNAPCWYDASSEFAPLVAALRTHTLTCLGDPQRRNHFPDGGVRLSSTSNNSWLSKIFLLQHVCRELGWVPEGAFAASDAAHVKWVSTGESAYWAMSDQIVDGVAKGSKYYPRCVTAWLWL